MVFHRPNPHHFIPSHPPISTDIKRVLCCQVVGFYLMSITCLCNALILVKILYTFTMFYNYLIEHDKHQIRALLKKVKQWQLINTKYDLDSLAKKLIFILFKQSTYEFHSLNHLYTCNHNMCFSTSHNRWHNCITPAFKLDVTSKNYIMQIMQNSTQY